MKARFLHIGFNFVVTHKVKELEPVFTQNAIDWLRYAPNCWIVWTTKSAQEWYGILLHHITQADTVLIYALDPTQRYGWAPKWIWDWLDKNRAS